MLPARCARAEGEAQAARAARWTAPTLARARGSRVPEEARRRPSTGWRALLSPTLSLSLSLRRSNAAPAAAASVRARPADGKNAAAPPPLSRAARSSRFSSLLPRARCSKPLFTGVRAPTERREREMDRVSRKLRSPARFLSIQEKERLVVREEMRGQSERG